MQNKIDTVYLPGETNNLHPITEYSASLLETKKGMYGMPLRCPYQDKL